MKKAYLKIVISVLMLAILTSGIYVNAEEIIYDIKPVMTDVKYDMYLKDSLVMRVGNNHGIYNRRKTDMDRNYYRIVPYLQDGSIYVPIEYTVESFGFTFEKGEGSAVFEVNGRKYQAEDNQTPEGFKFPVRYSEKSFYAAAEDMAGVLGMNLYQDDKLVIISPNDMTNTSGNIIKEITDFLEWRWGRLNIGDEGFVTGMIVHPVDTDVRYMRTDVGGLYRWQPESETWRQLMSVIPADDYNLIGIRGVALDPQNSNIIYTASGMFTDRGPHAVLKSEDRGETWKQLNFDKLIGANVGYTRVSGECMAVDPNNSNRVFIGTINDGLWYSDDGGETWRQNNAIQEWTDGFGINLITYDQRTGVDEYGYSTDMYVSVWGDGLYKSSDAGKTFTRIEGTPKEVTRVQWVNGALYFTSRTTTVDEMAIGYYKDGKWTDLTPEYFTQNASQVNYGFAGIMVDRTNPDVILTMGAPWTGNASYVYRTLNGGKDWEVARVGHFASGCSSLTQDPDDSKVVWNTNGTGVCVFTDIYEELPDLATATPGASTISYKPHQYGMEEMVVLKTLSVPHKDAPHLLIADYDRTYSFVEDPYTNATLAHDGHGSSGMVNAMDFCEASPNFVIRTGRPTETTSGVVLSTQYGRWGKRSENWDSSKTAVSCALSATVRENGYPVIMLSTSRLNGVNGSLYRSYDWGVTWEKLEGIETTVTNAKWSQYTNFILASDRVDSKTFYFTDSGKFYMTEDDGTTWNMLKDFGMEVNLYAVPGYEGWVYAQSNGTLYKSVDKGYNWEIVSTVQSIHRMSFGKGREDSAYPAMYLTGTINNKYGLYISDDMGQTWRRIDDDAVNPWVYNNKTIPTGDRKTYGRVFLGCGGTGVLYFQLADLDDLGPKITVENKSTSDTDPLSYAVTDNKIKIVGRTDEKAEVRINNIPVEVSSDYEFEYEVELTEGINNVRVEAVDKSRNKADPVYLTYRYDPEYMGILLDGSDSIVTNQSSYTVSGAVSEPANIEINGIKAVTDGENKFTVECPINAETKEIVVKASSLDGARTGSKTIGATYDATRPTVEFTNLTDEPYPKRVYILNGKIDEPGEVRVNDKNVEVKEDLTFTTFVTLDNEENTVKLQSRDVAGNLSKPEYFTIVKDIANMFDKTNLDLKYRSDSFVFDGDISEWDLEYELDEVYQGNVNNLAQIGLMWDEEYLYAAFKVTDSVLYTGNGTIYLNDCMEVYIDGDNHKGPYNMTSKQYQLLPGTTSHVAISKITDDGYVSEWKIPWTQVYITPTAGSKVGIDLNTIDNDGEATGDTRDGVQGFNGSMQNWESTALYTTFTLIK